MSGAEAVAKVLPRSVKRWRTPLLPRQSATSRPLLMAIAVMCFLATLAAVSVTMMNDAAESWTSDIQGSVTVQLPPPSAAAPQAEADSQIMRVLALLEGTSGIVSAHALTRQESAELLEPWLGAGNVGPDLPIPQLINVTIDPVSPPDIEALRRALEAAVPDAVLDDHTQWNDRILVFAGLWRALALATLLLVLLCTGAIVTFATRASLAAQHEIVDVFHLIGAHDRFIAREFRRQFLRIAIKGSVAGVAAALAGIALMAMVARHYLEAEGALLLPVETLDARYLLALIAIPIIVALVVAVTTHVTVLRSIARSL